MALKASVSPLSDLFKGHSYFFAASKEAKWSVDFRALAGKIRRHGGTVETVPSPGLERFLITDIVEEARLVKLIGKQALVSRHTLYSLTLKQVFKRLIRSDVAAEAGRQPSTSEA
jgi:hypothetical protein